VLYAAALDPSQKFGSLEEQVCLLGRAFRERGGRFVPLFLAAPGPAAARAFADAGAEAHGLDLRRLRLGQLSRLLGLVRRHRVEVIHWNFYEPLANPYVWCLTALAPRVAHYFTDHNSRYLSAEHSAGRLKGALKRTLLRRYEKVICVSRYVQGCLEGEGSWPDLTCCLHFVNTDRFRPDPEARAAVRARHGAGGRFVLVAVAHLIREKGIAIALRALAALPDDVVLWVAGGGPEAGALQHLHAELRLGGRVEFLGLQRDVAPYLQAADCFVCPSLWAEAAGLVNLEAHACGLPVVASRVGGIPEYVVEGSTGLLFAPGDAVGLAECVRRLRDDPAGRERMARAARALAVGRFSPGSRLNDYLDLYRC
jgi:glycosyltransferase involved in cell wall biosynthesis